LFKNPDILYNTCPDTLSFRHKCHRQIVKGIKRPNHVRLAVTCTVVAEDRHLETDVPSTRSSMAPIDRLEVIRGTSVEIPPFLVRYRTSFFMDLVTQLQLWHLHFQMPVRAVRRNRGSTVVKVLRYKSEGRWFDPRWCRFFNDINPSDRTMALGSTQPLTEMSTRRISWG
jgi:hypothetical protein